MEMFNQNQRIIFLFKFLLKKYDHLLTRDTISQSTKSLLGHSLIPKLQVILCCFVISKYFISSA